MNETRLHCITLKLDVTTDTNRDHFLWESSFSNNTDYRPRVSTPNSVKRFFRSSKLINPRKIESCPRSRLLPDLNFNQKTHKLIKLSSPRADYSKKPSYLNSKFLNQDSLFRNTKALYKRGS